MTNYSASKPFRAAILTAVVAFTVTAAFAAAPQSRITQAISSQSRVELPGTLSPHARPAIDAGRVSATTKLSAITLVFSRTPAQQAALDALTAAQQNPASPQYHRFLTPEQFGAQFGVSASDIAATESWLQQQGFTVDSVSRSRDRIQFSGTVAQAESAFNTQLHYYAVGNEKHFAPSTALSVPSALASSVLTITNLSDFRPHPHVKFNNLAKPAYTSGQTGNIYLDPKDIATIYDVNAAYNAGYNGAGQSIAVIGQTAIVPLDITNFQTGLGLTAKAPTLILVPGTGGSFVSPGDEAESDLDLEYSSSMAPGATIYFVYTGSGGTNNDGVFTSLAYAIDNLTAPIVTLSYGDCEADLQSGEYAQINAVLQQGAAQGQTIITSAGDTGSTDCFEDTTLSAATIESVSADFPSTSQYVTSMGGTEIPSADISSTYFTASTGGADVVSSAKSYVPEQVWNDDAYAVSQGATGTQALSSGGGGTSTVTARPTWQTSYPDIPTGTFRLVPDISLLASNYFPGYIYCTSDSTAWSNGQQSSCTNGLRDSSSQDFTLAGGTSFDAPIFAGLMAILNQAKGYATGQGLVNPELYTLATNPATYTSAFHDITSGSNKCLAGSTYCSTAGAGVYAATTGYDEASGLGSIDFYNLLTAWPTSATGAGLIASTTTLSPATTTPAIGAADIITITVASTSTTVTTPPTGTVSVSVNGTVVNAALPLTNGTATYSYSSATAGTDLIKGVYSGDTTYTTSNSSTQINVGAGTATLTATSVTVAQGSSGTTTLTLTPGNGYKGDFTFLTINSPQGLSNACVSDPADIIITGTAAASSTMTIYTSITQCGGNNVVPLVKGASGTLRNGLHLRVATGAAPARIPSRSNPFGPTSSGIAAASLLLVGVFSRRSRRLRAIVTICLLTLAGFAITGCSNNSSTPLPVSATGAPKGTYALTITGADTVDGTVTGSANFTLTIN